MFEVRAKVEACQKNAQVGQDFLLAHKLMDLGLVLEWLDWLDDIKSKKVVMCEVDVIWVSSLLLESQENLKDRTTIKYQYIPWSK